MIDPTEYDLAPRPGLSWWTKPVLAGIALWLLLAWIAWHVGWFLLAPGP